MDSVSPTSVPPNRRRFKAQLSCNPCRQKKRRCDRERPCQACIARGVGVSCVYPTRSIAQSTTPASCGATLRSRLDVLENSILSLLHSSGDPEPQPAVTPSDKPKAESFPGTSTSSQIQGRLESGSMRYGSSGAVYVSSAHWTTILDNISDMRECIGREGRDGLLEHHDQLRQPAEPHAEVLPADVPHLFSGLRSVPTKAEVLSAMPDRLIVDRHVSWHLNRMPLVYLHIPSFLRQYEAFWANPSDVPVMWLSILYSIMCMTPLDHVASAAMCGDAGPGRSGLSQPKYLEQVIQCLMIGDYSRGGPYAIEALHHYFVVEHVTRHDADVRNWCLYGVIVRLALREGYHREPSRFPSITPFEGELRRRLWMTLYGMDVVVSVQMGMPRMIKDEQCDIKPPRNLLDTDFDEDTKELPAPRPDKEMTPVLSWEVRYRMMIIIAKIADTSHMINGDEDPCSSPRIRQMDTLLRATYSQLPPGVKFTSLSSCLGSSAEDIAYKLSVSILFQKGLIILHRRHAVGERPPKDSSRPQCSAACICESARTCIDAALQLLEYQDFVHRESQGGGVLVSLRWRLFSSPISHEFLMALSVLCSYLYRVYRDDSDVAGVSAERLHEIEKALSRTYWIWRSRCTYSKDAQRATDILGMLIRKLEGRVASMTQSEDELDISMGQLNDLMPASRFGIEGTMLSDGFGFGRSSTFLDYQGTPQGPAFDVPSHSLNKSK